MDWFHRFFLLSLYAGQRKAAAAFAAAVFYGWVLGDWLVPGRGGSMLQVNVDAGAPQNQGIAVQVEIEGPGLEGRGLDGDLAASGVPGEVLGLVEDLDVAGLVGVEPDGNQLAHVKGQIDVDQTRCVFHLAGPGGIGQLFFSCLGGLAAVSTTGSQKAQEQKDAGDKKQNSFLHTETLPFFAWCPGREPVGKFTITFF